MLKEVTEFVFNKGFAAGKRDNENKVNFLDRLSDPTTIVYEFNGNIVEHAVKPELRHHTVDSVEDLIQACSEWGSEGVLWIDSSQVVLVVNDAERRERVTLPLKYSGTFEACRKLEANGYLDQMTLVRLLRREFRHAPEATTLLSAVRKIKFRKLETGHADITHGNESLGSAIEAEVTGADDIATTLVVPTAIYANPGEQDNTYSVTLDLEIDVHKQKFILRPMPDETERAITSALDSIKDRLVNESGLTVLYGRP